MPEAGRIVPPLLSGSAQRQWFGTATAGYRAAAVHGIGGTACSSPLKSTEEYSRSLVSRW